MRAIIQRVKYASVKVDAKVKGEIGHGILVFLGVGQGDTKEDLDYIVRKSAELRIFEDENEKMNLSVEDVAGGVLVISQFTLYGDCRKGRRPDFNSAMKPTGAEIMYEAYIAEMEARGLFVRHGEFGADMQVELLNDGPVTIILDSSKLF